MMTVPESMKKCNKIVKHTKMASSARRQIIGGGGAPIIKNRRRRLKIDGDGGAAQVSSVEND